MLMTNRTGLVDSHIRASTVLTQQQQ